MSLIAREILPMRIEDEMRLSYTRYAMSVIIGRALPDARDGLKPVHRRILYAMFDQNMTPDRRREKCASAVGEVLKKYHPHGDQSVYDALVRMAQDFSLRYPLIDGQGNFGSVDGDSAAAYRYTEARLSPIAMELLRDIEMETVDFVPNFSESTTEPFVLPSVYPNMMVNGSSGIAVGMATNIPPHNLGETCEAVAFLLDNPQIAVEDLVNRLISEKILMGPDFPTGGLILGQKGLRSAYLTGRGSVIMQARATIEPIDGGRQSILITELPYQVNKATLIENIAAQYRDKKIEGISELRDESDRNGMRIVIELKREANPNVILNYLYKHTALRTSFGIINLSVLHGQPLVLNLKQTLEAFIEHRKTVITRRSVFQLKKAEARAHILEGLRAILASIDDVIALIRGSQSREDARNKLMNDGVPRRGDNLQLTKSEDGDNMIRLSEIQANAVLDMRLGQLTQLDRMKIDDEFADLVKEIERLKSILEDERKVRQIIKADMTRIKKEYSDARRTQILDKEAQDIKIEDLISEEDVIVTITRDGYVKKLPVDTYRTQGRGGKGIIGLTKKEEDLVEHLFICTTHHTLLFFTNRGRIYQLKAYEVPSASRTSRGTPIVNMLQVEKGEQVTAVLNIADFSDGRYLFMVTKDGTVKKTALADYATRRTGGIIAINLDGKDELRFVFQTDGKKEVIMATRQGLSIRFNEDDVRATGRNSMGVTGMRFKGKGDYIVGAAVADLQDHVLVVSEEGLGKRSSVEDYRLQTRGGSGVITLKVTEKTGELISLQVVKSDEELLIITKNGVIIRQRTDEIRETGRVAQGVKLIRLGEGDRVAAVAKILQEADGDVLNDDEPTAGQSFEEANGIVSGAKSNNTRSKVAEFNGATSNGDSNGAAHDED
jgi:DNA gyrase subunit A